MKTERPCRAQSPSEETANAVTHGLGVLLVVLAAPLLLERATAHGSFSLLAAIGIFALTMLGTYLSSTLYHACRHPELKQRCHVADHISIFFFIAGTHTPLVLLYTPPGVAAPFLTVMWSLVVLGSLLKLYFTGRYDWLSTLFYLALGWAFLFLLDWFMRSMPGPVFQYLIAGGICYSVGVIFYRMRGVRFAHVVWHLLVLGGSALHFLAVYESC